MKAALVALALVAAAATAQAQAPSPPVAKTRVAVIVDLAANVSPQRATELAAAMASALQRTLQVDATGGADVTRRLPPDGVPDDCVAVPECIRDLGRRLDATEMLFLALVQVGTVTQVESTWIRADTGETRSRPRVDVPADARAGEVFAANADRLLPDAPHRAAAVVIAPSGPPAPRRHMSGLTWTLAGVSLAALVGGGALGLSARANYQRCDDDPDRCAQADRDKIRTRALLGDALAAVGAITGGVTLVLYLRSARAPVQASITPVPAGAMADVRFEF